MQGIYRINYFGKCAYVGSALDTVRRFRQHIDTLRRQVHKNFVLQRIWNKHGNIFEFIEIEEVVEQKDLIKREQFYMDLLRPICNLAKANGSRPHSEEDKKKMRGRIVSKETRMKMSNFRKGKPSPRRGIKSGIVPKTTFKKGMIPHNKKYSKEELIEKKRQWSREAAARHRKKHAERLKEYKKLKAREYRARNKKLSYAAG